MKSNAGNKYKLQANLKGCENYSIISTTLFYIIIRIMREDVI